MRTLYIAPTLTDMGGQCRIYAHEGQVDSARDHYRENPEQWHEVGIMNFRGKLVCFDGTSEELTELRLCEPLAAGLVIECD